MKVVLTVAECAEIAETLSGLRGKQHPKLIMLSKVNFDRIHPIVKRSFEQRDALFTPAYKAFEADRDKAMAEFCAKHEFPKGTTNFGALNFQYEEMILEMTRSDAHKDAVEAFNEGLKDYSDSLNTEVELELQPLDLNWLPKKLNLLTFLRIKRLVKDADKYADHELETIDIQKGEVISIVQKIVGDNGHFSKGDAGKRPALEMVFALPIIRRIASFMDNARAITEEFSTLRRKHSSSQEFALFMEERNDILRQEIPMEDKVERINQAYAELPDEVRSTIEGADKEVSDFGIATIQMSVSKIRLDDFDEHIDTDLLSALFPLIRE